MSLTVNTSLLSKAAVVRMNRSPRAGCQASPAVSSARASSAEIIDALTSPSQE